MIKVAERLERAAPIDSRVTATGPTGFVTVVAVVAALGGLLFGYDTAVINGALVFLRREFALTDIQTQVVASSILLGAVLGAASAGVLSDRFGRKRTLLAAGALFFLSAIGAAVAADATQLSTARLIGGVAIGVASMASPLYIAEIAPASIRGRLVSLNQMAIVSGILLAYVINWLLADAGQANWRWMFAAASVPSLVFMLALLFVPESPRWLVQRGRDVDALRVLVRASAPGRAEALLESIRHAIDEERGVKERLWSPRLRRPMRIAITLAVLQQVTGINTVLYYGSIVFTEHAGQSASTAIGANAVIGLINLIGTVIALLVIDRIGRKPLLIGATGGMAVSLTGLVAAFALGAGGWVVLLPILAYVACFAVGLGPGVWVLMSELFPTAVRGRAMSVATVSLWAACTGITLTFLSLVSFATIAGAFAVYAVLSVVTLMFVWRGVPETKGRTLEEIERSWG